MLPANPAQTPQQNLLDGRNFYGDRRVHHYPPIRLHRNANAAPTEGTPQFVPERAVPALYLTKL
jgi:hypothetical protein